MRRLAVALPFTILVATAAIAFSCTIFNGVVADPPDSGAAIPPDVASEPTPQDAGDGCEHKLPIATRPSPEDRPAITEDFVVVGKSVRFRDKSFGYDLDGLCSCPHQGSCIPPDAQPPSVACDGEGGVDNVGGPLAANIPGLDLEKIANDGITAGDNAIIVRIDDYNGTPNDPSITVSFFRSLGPLSETGEKIQPNFDQLQEWSIDPTSMSETTAGTAKERGPGYVVNNVLVADLSSVTVLPSLELAFRKPVITGEVRRNTTLNRFYLTNVIVAGRWPVQEALNAIGQFQGDDGLRLCDPNSKYHALGYAFMRQSICASLDITIDPNNRGARCDAISGGALIETVPAKRGREVDAGIAVQPCAVAKPCD